MRRLGALVAASLLALTAPAARAVDLSQVMVDLSSLNDFGAVAKLANKHQIELLMLRATLGVGDDDREFAKRLGLTVKSNLKVGAYHAMFPSHTGVEQARYFVKQVSAACATGTKVLLVVDWETPRTKTGKTYEVPSVQMVEDFLDETQRLTGETPMIYTGIDIIENHRTQITPKLAGANLWIATYLRSIWRPQDCRKEGRDADAAYRCGKAIHGLIMPLEGDYNPWSDWTFWQFSEGKWQDEAFRRRHAVGDAPVDVSFFGGGRDTFHQFFEDNAWTCDHALAATL